MSYAPPVPPEVDLRGMPFMPLDIVRLLDSDIFALSTGDEFKAAVALWGRSWLQVPAASLPDDDRVLAHLSGAGTRWKRVKAMAMRGWILCTDGRYYHPVVAEKALEAWRHRLAQRARAEKRWAPSRGNAAADLSTARPPKPATDAAASTTASKNGATARKTDATAHATAMQGTVKGQKDLGSTTSPTRGRGGQPRLKNPRDLQGQDRAQVELNRQIGVALAKGDSAQAAKLRASGNGPPPNPPAAGPDLQRRIDEAIAANDLELVIKLREEGAGAAAEPAPRARVSEET